MRFPSQLLTGRHWSSGGFCWARRGSPCGRRYSPCPQTGSNEASSLQQPLPAQDLYGSQLESLQRHKTPPKNVTCYLASFSMLSSHRKVYLDTTLDTSMISNIHRERLFTKVCPRGPCPEPKRSQKQLFEVLLQCINQKLSTRSRQTHMHLCANLPG